MKISRDYKLLFLSRRGHDVARLDFIRRGINSPGQKSVRRNCSIGAKRYFTTVSKIAARFYRASRAIMYIYKIPPRFCTLYCHDHLAKISVILHDDCHRSRDEFRRCNVHFLSRDDRNELLAVSKRQRMVSLLRSEANV